MCFLSRYLLVMVCCLFSYTSLLEEDGSKLDDCKQCEVMTNSFNHWVTKTSRGKFEGGDVAWEEAKLKSYARSEVRLVEIQEGLCSDVKKYKDQCYSIAEETEHLIEQWWGIESPVSADLYTWLCIETLGMCCPQSHYGELCDPCPLYNKTVCNGQGNCDGEGTRKGSGVCKCFKGYVGNYCEECVHNFYRSIAGKCELCHRSCDGCDGEGANSCLGCRSGWEHIKENCVDIDECKDSNACKPGQYCINVEGSYICKSCHSSCDKCSGSSETECTACKDDHILWGNMCFEEEMRISLIKKSIQLLVVYIGLLIITGFIYRKSKILASFVIAVLAVYIYFSENMSRITLSHLLLYVFSSN